MRNKYIYKIMKEFPLDKLLDEGQLEKFIDEDRPVLFYFKDKENMRTISAPHMISMMTSLLELEASDQVLILGGKGGVMEGIIAQAVASVTIIEQHPDVYQITKLNLEKLRLTNVTVHLGNPLNGVIEEGPYTKVLITGAVPLVPSTILKQCTNKAILVLPLIISDPIFQMIIQVVVGSAPKEYEISNYGGVIFSPLYTESLPPLNPELDLTFQTMIEHAANRELPEILEIGEFFSEYSQLPKLEFQQIFFKNQNLPSIEIENWTIKDKIILPLEFWIYNPDLHKTTGYILTKILLEQKKRREFILKQDVPFEFSFTSQPIDFPIRDGISSLVNVEIPTELLTKREKSSSDSDGFEFDFIFDIDCTIIGPKNYRISHCSAKMHCYGDKESIIFALEYDPVI